MAHSRTRFIAYSGVFLAISVLLSFASIYFGPNLKVSLAPAVVMYAGLVMGPAAGAAIGAATDILVLFLKPLPGAYFFGFTLTMAMYGLLGGIVYGRRGSRPGLARIVLGTLAIQAVCSVLLNTMWLCVLSNVPFGPMLVTRLPLSGIADAVYTVILYLLVRFQEKVLPRALV